MKTAEVNFFKEHRNGELTTTITKLNIPKGCRAAAVVKDYIKRFNKGRFTKIYWYEILKVTSSTQS